MGKNCEIMTSDHDKNNHFRQRGHIPTHLFDYNRPEWLTLYILREMTNFTIISFIKWSITLCDIAGLQWQKQWNLSFFFVES